MGSNTQKGFTITEFLMALSVLIIFSQFGCGYMAARHKAKEVEAKSNLHTIQIAVERYNIDHHEYPAYLLGGDTQGWLAWHERNDEEEPTWEEPSNNWVCDPLLKWNYMTSYPQNPFINPDDRSIIIDATSFIDNPGPGDGDPRFGYRGNIMGMGLDDPNFFENAHPDLPYSRIETKRTLDRGKIENPEGFPRRHPAEGELAGLYYNWGGRIDLNGRTVIAFWSGNFFYRSAVDILLTEGWPYPNANGQGHRTRFMLGVWGSSSNEGKDVIRLQDVTPDSSRERIYWRYPPSDDEKYDSIACGYSGKIGEPMGLPAVFGGGDESTGPFFPADRDSDSLGHSIFGAPDGVMDGIILTLNTGFER